MQARKACRTFVADGIPLGRRPEFQGSGLVRSLGGWRAVAVLRRGREAYLGDERILGSAEFVEKVRGTLQTTDPLPGRRRPLAALVAGVCAATGCHPTALQQDSRRGRGARALPTLPWRSAGTLAAPSPTCWGCVSRRSTGLRNGAAPLGGGGRGCSQSARRERILGSNVSYAVYGQP